jgi:hypothetical protein
MRRAQTGFVRADVHGCGCVALDRARGRQMIRGRIAMGHVLAVLMVLLLAVVTCAHAQAVRPGDQVRFVARDQHIPAHPAPGDSRVHLRFVSGSEATVLRVHAATGWIEVRGEPLQGTENTGWVTPRHLAGQPGGGGPTTDPLAWCPPKGAPDPHPSGRCGSPRGTWRTSTPRTASRPTRGRTRPSPAPPWITSASAAMCGSSTPTSSPCKRWTVRRR